MTLQAGRNCSPVETRKPCCGPGGIAVAHAATEYVELEQIQACE